MEVRGDAALARNEHDLRLGRSDEHINVEHQRCQGGVDVQAGYAPTGQIGHVNLASDTIESYQKNGVTVDSTGSTGKINGVTVTGAGPTTAIAQNGVQISLGATGTVTDSTITGNDYTGRVN